VNVWNLKDSFASTAHNHCSAFCTSFLRGRSGDFWTGRDRGVMGLFLESAATAAVGGVVKWSLLGGDDMVI